MQGLVDIAGSFGLSLVRDVSALPQARYQIRRGHEMLGMFSNTRQVDEWLQEFEASQKQGGFVDVFDEPAPLSGLRVPAPTPSPAPVKPAIVSVVEIEAIEIVETVEIQQPAQPVAQKVGRKDPLAVLENMAEIMDQLKTLPVKKVARDLKTSEGRLRKRMKAYELIYQFASVRHAFLDGQLSWSYLQEMAVRRDGQEQIREKLGLVNL